MRSECANSRPKINAYIDRRAEALKAETPGGPLNVCRNLLTVRSGDCECRAYLNLVEQE